MYLLTTAVQQQCPLLRYFVCELFSIGLTGYLSQRCWIDRIFWSQVEHQRARVYLRHLPAPVWSTLVHNGPLISRSGGPSGPQWSLRQRSQPSQSLVHSGPQWSLRQRSQPSQSLVHSGPQWSTTVHNAQEGPPVPLVPIWSTLVPIWSTLVHNGPLISRLCKQLT